LFWQTVDNTGYRLILDNQYKGKNNVQFRNSL
jgi:hypothetical protein